MIHRSTTPRTDFVGTPDTGVRPAAQSDADREREHEAVHAKLRLLFVDDDPLAEMTLRRAFKRLGIDAPLTIARDGLEALDVLRDPWFQLDRCVLLVDLNMPRMDGIELIKELRADPHLVHLPVVMMSTSDDPRDIQLAYQVGAAGYLVKPSAFSELVEHVRVLVEYWSRAMLARPKQKSGAFALP